MDGLGFRGSGGRRIRMRQPCSNRYGRWWIHSRPAAGRSGVLQLAFVVQPLLLRLALVLSRNWKASTQVGAFFRLDCLRSRKKCLHCLVRVLTYSPLFARSRDVAQFGRALRSGRRGRRFKSCRPDHLIAPAFLFSGHIGRAPKLGGLHENLWSWSS